MINFISTIQATRCFAWIGLGVLPVVLGCGAGTKYTAPPTVAVKGTVTYKGQALDGAQVAFINTDKEGGKPANGITDSAGNFQLQTFLGGSTQAKGAMPGDYIVTIQKVEASAAGTAPGGATTKIVGAPSGSGAMVNAPKLLTPEKYADPTKAEKVTVKADGENVFKFDLVD